MPAEFTLEDFLLWLESFKLAQNDVRPELLTRQLGDQVTRAVNTIQSSPLGSVPLPLQSAPPLLP